MLFELPARLLDCVYEQARRDRLREFVCPEILSFHLLNAYRATQLNHTLATLLQDLSEHVNNDDKQRIDNAL
jgi:hypothetical protein